MGEVFSSNEIEQLLQAIQDFGSATDRPGMDGLLDKSYSFHDFKRPCRISMEHKREITHHAGTVFGSRLAHRLSERLRLPTSCQVLMAELLRYEEYLRSVPPLGLFAVYDVSPALGEVLIDIDAMVWKIVVDRVCGGRGVPSQGSIMPTELELELLTPMLLECGIQLAESWRPVRAGLPRMLSVQTEARRVQIAPDYEMVMLVGLKLCLGEYEGCLNVLMPVSALEPSLQALAPKAAVLGAGDIADESMPLSGAVAELLVHPWVEFSLGRYCRLKDIDKLLPGSRLKVTPRQAVLGFVQEEPEWPEPGTMQTGPALPLQDEAWSRLGMVAEPLRFRLMENPLTLERCQQRDARQYRIDNYIECPGCLYWGKQALGWARLKREGSSWELVLADQGLERPEALASSLTFNLTVELGRVLLTNSQLGRLRPGDIQSIGSAIGWSAEVRIGQYLWAYGDVVDTADGPGICLAELNPTERGTASSSPSQVDGQIELSLVYGRLSKATHELTATVPGTIFMLTPPSGAEACLEASGRPLAYGDVEVIDENFVFRVRSLAGEAGTGSSTKAGSYHFDAGTEPGAEQLFSLLVAEQPQTIALVLAGLSSRTADRVLELLPDDTKTLVTVCLDSLDWIAPDVVRGLNRWLRTTKDRALPEKFLMAGGAERLGGA